MGTLSDGLPPSLKSQEDPPPFVPTAVVPRVLRQRGVTEEMEDRLACAEPQYGNQHPSLGVFGWHRPTPKQASDMETLRASFSLLANRILLTAPESPDRTTALRCLREAMMWTNAAIVTGGAGIR